MDVNTTSVYSYNGQKAYGRREAQEKFGMSGRRLTVLVKKGVVKTINNQNAISDEKRNTVQ